MMAALLVCLSVLFGATDAGVSDGGAATPDAGLEAGVPDASKPEDPRVKDLRRQSQRIRELSANKLNLTVDAPRLFTVPLDDDRAVLLEARRLNVIVEAADALTRDTEADHDAGPDASPISQDADASAIAADADIEDPYADLPAEVWEARVELDRARLEIYLLPKQKRLALLEAHAKRQKDHSEADKAKRLSEAEAAAKKAKEARDKARRAAENAANEAIRLVEQERADLLDLKFELNKVKADLIRDSQETDDQSKVGVEWHGKVQELIQRHDDGGRDPAEADRLYKELRGTLRELRTKLGVALSKHTAPSSVKDVGTDPLANLDIDKEELPALRSELHAKSLELKQQEAAQRWKRASLLMQQVELLNTDRLELYHYVSPSWRRSLKGFDTEGWTQAVAEGHQVQLVVHYHVLAIGEWVRSIAASGEPRTAAFFLGFDLLKILGLAVLTAWGLRRLGPLLRAWRDGLPLPVLATEPTPATRLHLWLGVLDRVRVPLGWLLAGWLALWILGSYQKLLEVRLIWTVIAWNLGGIFVVNLIDALAGRRDSDDEVSDTARLRLSTLRLIGRTVVLIALTLSLSALLVGRGTIHAWVLATCWFLAIPLGLLIVSWWRTTIFERLHPLRSGDRVANWVVEREERWSSFLAATVGGVYLLTQNAIRLGKLYLSEFIVARRILAYLFRRELAKQSGLEVGGGQLEPLDEAHLLPFDPEARPPELLPTAADDDVARVLGAIDAPGGGVFAIVGERGLGKSTLLDRIRQERENALLLQCPLGGVEELLATMRAHHQMTHSSDEELIDVIEKRRREGAVLIDDAQRLVTPAIGGLAQLDRLIAIARASSETCTWVLAFDRGLWQFVQRSRGARPLFDGVIRLHPWTEEQIAALVQQRSGHSGVDASFEALVAHLSEDEVQRAEQLARTAAGFHRLLWDYSEGNPAVALQFWGHSLKQDAAGQVHARLFNAPSLDDLESLPDTAAFVLYSVIQLEPVHLERLEAIIRLPSRDVMDSVRYSLSRGYLERIDGRVRVSWHWYRAITSLLERRHLQED